MDSEVKNDEVKTVSEKDVTKEVFDDSYIVNEQEDQSSVSDEMIKENGEPVSLVEKFGLKPMILFVSMIILPFLLIQELDVYVRGILCFIGVVLSVLYFEKYFDYKLDEPFRANKILVHDWTNTFEDMTASLDINTEALAKTVAENNKIIGKVIDDFAVCQEDVSKNVKTLREIGGKTLGYIEQNIAQEVIENKSDSTIVINTKRDNLLIHSELLENGVLQYMAEYNNGRISHSRTFDNAGKMTNECIYDKNGNVDKRLTYKFDKDGDVREVIPE